MEWEADIASLPSPEHAVTTAEASSDLWRFVSEQLCCLRGCFSIVDVADNDVSSSEYWTAVHLRQFASVSGATITNPRRSFHRAIDYAPHYSALRDVLVTVSLLASSDLEKWIQLLQKSLGVDIPAALDHEGHDAAFAHRFILDLQVGDDDEEDERIACEQLLCLFDDENPTTTTREQHWRQLTIRIASSMEDDSRSMAPGVTFRLQPSFRSLEDASLVKQCERLRCVTDVLTAIKKLQERQRSDTNSRVKLLLDSVDLDLSLLTVHESTFKEITRLVKTGVCVNVLTLPQSLPTDPGHRDTKLREAWAVLACTLCGHPPCGPMGDSVAVRYVVLLELYSTHELFFVPFFSALRDSRGLEKLKITIDDSTNRSDNATLACSFWAWLAFALFSSSSSSSVEALDLSNILFTPFLLDTITRIVRAEDATRVLHDVATGTTAPPSLARSVVMNVGSWIHSIGVGIASSPFRLPTLWNGVVVDDREAKGTTTMLLPGFGFCLYDEPDANKTKRRRINEGGSSASAGRTGTGISSLRSRLHALSLAGIPMTLPTDANRLQCDLVTRFVELIGKGVTRLDLAKYPLIREDAQDKILLACPQLMHLRLTGGLFSPEQFFSHANARRSRVVSLHLVGLWLPLAQVESFLRQLILDGPLKTSVRKLHIEGLNTIGDGETVATCLARIFRHQPPLTDFRVSVSTGGSVFRTMLAPFHGQIVLMGPLPLRHRLAVVSCQVGANDALCRLDPDSMHLIFEFAAPTTKRRIVVQEEIRQAGLWWHYR